MFATAAAPSIGLVVFDLDYTLWPFWVDTHVTPPFRKAENKAVYDAANNLVEYYPEVPNILNLLQSKNIQMAVASRTSCIREANELIVLFGWSKYFTFKEIYPGSKVEHFKKLQEYTGLSYKNMLFFDDEHRNIAEVGNLGVTCIWVQGGMTLKELDQGLKAFDQARDEI
uniref:Magnesium-dependent phosphatase 1 n=1 Tax=Strigamia maritima TaxID=126957 RepID=T1J551_STRMM